MEAVRRRVRIGALGALVLTLVVGGVLAHRVWSQRHLPSYGLTVALRSDGRPVQVTGLDELLPGSRVLARDPATDRAAPGRTAAGTTAAERLAAGQRRWMRAGTVPTVPELGPTSMFGDALLDLDTLSRPSGVAVAGWAPPWRYVWPRDAAFVASALARTGHPADAVRTLDFLQRVQLADGTFRPRSAPDGTGAPDDRAVQYDNTGWAAWALAEVVRPLPAGQARTVLVDHRALLDRSARALVRLTRQGTALPPVSPDYWETAEREVTLESSAALLLGLRSVATAYRLLGESPATTELTGIAGRYQQVILHRFADDGFPRHPGGPPRTVDLGVALLMPPFSHLADPRVEAAWQTSTRYLARPGGGLAPGGSWRRDGVSWTNISATYAMVESCAADRTSAVDTLRWLDRHRTPLGSLPEKVLPDGSPAYVAPLAWTSAATLIAADQLENGCAAGSIDTQ